MPTEIRIKETEAGAMFDIFDENGRLVARSPIHNDGKQARAAAENLVRCLRDAVTIKGGPAFEPAKATLIWDGKGRPNSTSREKDQ